MLPYLCQKNMKIHFITSYVPNSKYKLHRTRKFCRTYELQYTHCFLWAKTDTDRGGEMLSSSSIFDKKTHHCNFLHLCKQLLKLKNVV